MLLRTVVLLFVCVSTGLCATLGHYQIQLEEDEVPLVDSAAVTDGVVAAEEAAAPADTQLGDSPAVEEPAAPSILDDDLLAEIPAEDNPSDDEPEVDVPVADVATAEEPETDSERPAGDPPAPSILGDDLLAEIPAEDNPSDDEPEVDVSVEDDATAEEPETDSERPAGDPPAVEALTGEADTQEQPSSTEAEEDNDITPVETNQFINEPVEKEEDSSWSLNSIRNSFQSMHGYFGSLVELAGGHDGVCQYRCRYGQLPQPRPGYQLQEPNGCSSSLVGFQVNAVIDLGIPAMTTCCNQLDMCYESCGTNKDDCDSEFRLCLHGICSDLKKSLGFVSKVQACESMADALHSTVGTLGCRPYLDSQRAACFCEGEERDEL